MSEPETSEATPTGVAARTDPSNLGQLDSWDGDGGAFWADQADRFDAGVARYHGPFLAAASIADTDTVLDVGCGNGLTSRDAARRAAAGSVLGVDLSSRMIDLARRRAADEYLTNVTFEQADARSPLLLRTPSTSPSAATGACSSATPSRRSPTSPVPFGRVDGWSC